MPIHTHAFRICIFFYIIEVTWMAGGNSGFKICISENSMVITQGAGEEQDLDSTLEDGDWERAALSAGRGSCPSGRNRS